MSTREERLRAIDAAVFRTITGDDWRRALAAARVETNAVREQIRVRILAQNNFYDEHHLNNRRERE